MSDPAPPSDPRQAGRSSLLAAVQALVRVIRTTLNTPDADGGMSPAHGRFVRPVPPENIGAVLQIPLGSVLEGPNLEQMDLSRCERPGPVLRAAVALRDARAALIACPNAHHLQALWGELLAHRLYDVMFDAETEWHFGDQTSHHRAIFRPVEETLLANLLEAAAAPAAADGQPETPPRRMTVSQRMLLELQAHPEYLSRTQREWADALACSASTVNDAPAWKTILKVRAGNAAERQKRSVPSA